MATTVHARLTSGEGRQFGLTLGSAFLAFAMFAWWRGRPNSAVVLGTIGLVLAIAGILISTRLAPGERAWMALARAISFVTTSIVMAVMYFGIITPVGLLRRLVDDNPIVRAPRARDTGRRVQRGVPRTWSASSKGLSDESHQ